MTGRTIAQKIGIAFVTAYAVNLACQPWLGFWRSALEGILVANLILMYIDDRAARRRK